MKRVQLRLGEVLGSLIVAALVLVVLIVGLIFGLPSRYKHQIPSTITHDGSSLTGKYLSKYNQEVWYGIQYAQPPTGHLRFAGPQPINGTNTWRGGLDASVPGPMCPQVGSLSEMSESCLLANIQRPKRQSPSEPLPVVLFVHGGAFQSGSGLDFNPSKFISVGQNLSQPFITVTINYRLGLLGFMSSSDLSELAGIDPLTGLENPAASKTSNVRLNRGYLDVEQAIRWTSENIGSWGGDPNHLIIYGQSAGANSIVAQIIASQGSPPKQITNSTSGRQRTLQRPLKPLFKGAILQSPPLVPLASPNIKDSQFSRVLEASNCTSSSTSSERVSCLRSLTWQQITKISVTETMLSSPSNRSLTPLGTFPWIPSLDGGSEFGGFYSNSTSASLASLEFANVPIIFGNNLDEGTAFAPKDFENVVTVNKTIPDSKAGNSSMTHDNPVMGHHNSTSLNSTVGDPNSNMMNSTSTNDTAGITDFDSWFQSSWFFKPFSNATNMTYSEIAREYPDIPADGSPYDPFGAPRTDRFFSGKDNQFKRTASLYGDLRFQSHRRLMLDAISQNSQNQSSSNNVPSWGYLYAQHSPGVAPFLGVPHSSDLLCIQFVTNKRCQLMAQQFISFIYNLDPNNSTLNLPNWPAYNLTSRSLMTYRSDGLSITADDFREDQIGYLNTQPVLKLTGR